MIRDLARGSVLPRETGRERSPVSWSGRSEQVELIHRAAAAYRRPD
jgi:hypothetical protein